MNHNESFTMKENSVMHTFVLTVAEQDVETAKKTVEYIERVFNPQSVILITTENVMDSPEISWPDSVTVMDENTIYPGMTIDRIQDILAEFTGKRSRAGWYFQQFLKMAYACNCADERYILWDADTIPLRPISFLSTDTKKLLFSMKSEHHTPYFSTMKRLFHGIVMKGIEKSFIAEHMIIDTKIMKELINAIKCDESLQGSTFYEKILYSIDTDVILKSGFSEYETYGNYVLTFHPDCYEMRELKSYRHGKNMLGYPDNNQLEWVGEEYDTISFEKWDKPGIGKLLCRVRWIRSHYSFSQVEKFCQLKGIRALSKIYKGLQALGNQD